MIFFTNKNVKYLFYKYNGYLLFRNLPTVLVGNSIQKIAENEIIRKEAQNRDWQYLVESVVKPLQKKKKKKR